MGAVMDLHEVATALIPQRRANPGDDLLTWMVQAEFDGKKMTDDELKAFFVLMGVASNDTTRHASAHAIAALLEVPRPARAAGRGRRGPGRHRRRGGAALGIAVAAHAPHRHPGHHRA